MGRKGRDTKMINSFFRGVGRTARAIERANRAYQAEARRQERAMNRMIANQEREMRRQERERALWEREQARIARENEKMRKQLAFEEEVKSIIEENELWTTLHEQVSSVVTETDLLEAIKTAEKERDDKRVKTLYKEPVPSHEQSKATAQSEADSKFKIDELTAELSLKEIDLSKMDSFRTEPTQKSVSEELKEEAKTVIKAFWPWTKKKLIKQYISEHLDEKLAKEQAEYRTEREAFIDKKVGLQDEIEKLKALIEKEKAEKAEFLKKREAQLYNQQLEVWTNERNELYRQYIESLQGQLDGNKTVVENELAAVLGDDELPMEYFVNFDYNPETGLVQLDLDLPEIEDGPNRKIVITPSGKQSIRNKAQKELSEDYAKCVCGLAILLAESAFDVSPKIKNVIVTGFTQRADPKTTLITDQYVYFVNFDRETFNKIDFEKYTSIQAFGFFHHHMDLMKSMTLKEIDLEKAKQKAESYIPVDYNNYTLKMTEPEN